MNCKTCQTGQSPLTRDLYICKYCDLISSRYTADKDIYDKDYCERYLKYKDSKVGFALMKLRSDLVYKYIKSGKVFDYGCATGIFHKSLNSGVEGLGYDINEHFGFDDLSELPGEKMEGLTMWDVVEHIDDPKDVVQYINAKYLFICTPSVDDFHGTDLGNWTHYRPHEHVHLFNEKSLSAFLNFCGYRVVEVNYNESKLRASGGEKNILTMVGKRMVGK